MEQAEQDSDSSKGKKGAAPKPEGRWMPRRLVSAPVNGAPEEANAKRPKMVDMLQVGSCEQGGGSCVATDDILPGSIKTVLRNALNLHRKSDSLTQGRWVSSWSKTCVCKRCAPIEVVQIEQLNYKELHHHPDSSELHHPDGGVLCSCRGTSTSAQSS